MHRRFISQEPIQSFRISIERFLEKHRCIRIASTMRGKITAIPNVLDLESSRMAL